MFSVRIFKIEFSLVDFLHISDVADPAQHTLQLAIQCGFFIWDFLKDTVYRNSPHILQELKQGILAAVISINEHTLAHIMQNFQR
jgi:hypothetical protein